jgi:hypothetical protein
MFELTFRIRMINAYTRHSNIPEFPDKSHSTPNILHGNRYYLRVNNSFIFRIKEGNLLYSSL